MQRARSNISVCDEPAKKSERSRAEHARRKQPVQCQERRFIAWVTVRWRVGDVWFVVFVVVDAIECSSNRSTRVGATDGRKETDDNMPRRTTFRSDQTEDREDRFRSLFVCWVLVSSTRLWRRVFVVLLAYRKIFNDCLFFRWLWENLKYYCHPTFWSFIKKYTTRNSFVFARRFLSQAKSVLQRKKKRMSASMMW